MSATEQCENPEKHAVIEASLQRVVRTLGFTDTKLLILGLIDTNAFLRPWTTYRDNYLLNAAYNEEGLCAGGERMGQLFNHILREVKEPSEQTSRLRENAPGRSHTVRLFSSLIHELTGPGCLYEYGRKNDEQWLRGACDELYKLVKHLRGEYVHGHGSLIDAIERRYPCKWLNEDESDPEELPVDDGSKMVDLEYQRNQRGPSNAIPNEAERHEREAEAEDADIYYTGFTEAESSTAEGYDGMEDGAAGADEEAKTDELQNREQDGEQRPLTPPAKAKKNDRVHRETGPRLDTFTSAPSQRKPSERPPSGSPGHNVREHQDELADTNFRGVSSQSDGNQNPPFPPLHGDIQMVPPEDAKTQSEPVAPQVGPGQREDADARSDNQREDPDSPPLVVPDDNIVPSDTTHSAKADDNPHTRAMPEAPTRIQANALIPLELPIPVPASEPAPKPRRPYRNPFVESDSESSESSGGRSRPPKRQRQGVENVSRARSRLEEAPRGQPAEQAEVPSSPLPLAPFRTSSHVPQMEVEETIPSSSSKAAPSATKSKFSDLLESIPDAPSTPKKNPSDLFLDFTRPRMPTQIGVFDVNAPFSPLPRDDPFVEEGFSFANPISIPDDSE